MSSGSRWVATARLDRGKKLAALAGIFTVAGLISGCSRLELSSTPPANISPASLRQWFSPLPAAPQATTPQQQARVTLGRQLFFDTRLSRNQNESCNTCHRLSNYGMDNTQYSPASVPGVWDTPRNTPTNYNAAFEFAQFWDGRAENLQAQAGGPMVAAHEMDLASHSDAVALVRSVPAYRNELHATFPGEADPVTLENVTASIAAFEEGLITPSPWDNYLRGDTAALSARQKEGLRVFLTYGCNTCHAGRDVGGISYQRLGDVYGWNNRSDPGREGVTHAAADRLFFKVPTLRNVAVTGPYFHNGSVTRLTDAIRLMATMQSGQPMSRKKAEEVADFLRSMTGRLPDAYIAPPTVPPTADSLASDLRAARGGY